MSKQIEEVVKQIEVDVNDGLRKIPLLARQKKFDKCRSTQEIVDMVWKKSDFSLDFEVGYLFGLERALEIMEATGLPIQDKNSIININ